LSRSTSMLSEKDWLNCRSSPPLKLSRLISSRALFWEEVTFVPDVLGAPGEEAFFFFLRPKSPLRMR
jgi:hypothetical protein